MIISLEKANDGKHKWIAHFTNGRKTRFGAAGASDYTIHKDKVRRDAYRARHAKDLLTNDPYRAGYLSYNILWGNNTNMNTNVKEYNQRFFSR